MGIDSVNQGATSNAQKVQKWHILKKDFSVPGGELGPTLKVKRHVVSKIYTDTIEKIYRWILKDWFACWFVFIVNKSIFSMQKNRYLVVYSINYQWHKNIVIEKMDILGIISFVLSYKILFQYFIE